jgi:CRP-like cAMP-binding protein
MMAFSGARLSRPTADPLEYLPRGSIVEVLRGEDLYREHQPASALYMLTRGRVAISLLSGTGRAIVVDLCAPEQFFGFNSLLYADRYAERATALEASVAMWWAAEEIERLVQKQPSLGIALIHTALQRKERLTGRLVAMASGSTVERVAHLLLTLADDCGESGTDGWMRIPAITHQMLADCVGTSREVVTTTMNQLRRQGYLSYSRKVITLSSDALRDLLKQPSARV